MIDGIDVKLIGQEMRLLCLHLWYTYLKSKLNAIKIQVFRCDCLNAVQLRRERSIVAMGKALKGQRAEDNPTKEMRRTRKSEKEVEDMGQLLRWKSREEVSLPFRATRGKIINT